MPDGDKAAPNSGPNPNDKEQPAEQPPAKPSPVINGPVTTPNANNVAGENNRDPQQDANQIAKSDLAAQNRMADATESMRDAAWAGIVLTVVGLILIMLTLRATKAAAGYAGRAAVATEAAVGEAKNTTIAAERSVAVAREMGEAQTRAYLTVTGGHVIYRAGFKPNATITISNTGNSPALNVKAVYHSSRSTITSPTPSGKVDVNARGAKLAHTIGAGREEELNLGIVDDSIVTRDGTIQQGPLRLIEGLLEYQTVFGVKTGEVDTETSFLFVSDIKPDAITANVREGKKSRHEMQLMPAYMSGWIADYRRVTGLARDEERRQKKQPKHRP